MVTVVVSSEGRTKSLGDAFDSLRGQTLRSAIAKVLVCGNASTAPVETVLGNYSDLPIDLKLARDNDTDVFRHAALAETETEFVAFLLENDWWSPSFLETSLALLEASPQSAAVYANFWESEDPRYPGRSSRTAWRVWLANECSFARPNVTLDEVGVFLATLLSRNLHPSTLVTRTDHLRVALPFVATMDEKYQVDRVLPLQLAAAGLVGYNASPQAFVRILPAQDEASNLAAITTRWLGEKYPEKLAAAAERFNRLVGTLPLEGPSHEAFPVLPAIMHGITGPQWTALAFDCGLNLLPQNEERKDGRWLLKQLCPPALFSSLSLRREKLHPYAVRR